MDLQRSRSLARFQAVIDDFVAVCQADGRVLAAYLSGSHALGTADAYSDLDLGVILANGSYDAFFAARTDFIRSLGEPVFLEDVAGDGFHLLVFILLNGVEGELSLSRENNFSQILGEKTKVLLDKTGRLTGAVHAQPRQSDDEQAARLHRLLVWFWYDLAQNVLTPLARHQHWTAVGGLEVLRRACIDLARLATDFITTGEGYDRLERDVPQERLQPLAATFCPPERHALLRATRALVGYYRTLAPSLARSHGLAYPTELDRLVSARLEAMAETDNNNERP